jgi:hypothetical protein
VRGLLAALAAGLMVASAPPGASEPASWAVLSGLWHEAGARHCKPETGPEAGAWLRLEGSRVSLALSQPEVAGTVSGWRAITPVRWYLDISAADDLVLLDIVRVSADRLLVAKRPLGEARWLIRCRSE